MKTETPTPSSRLRELARANRGDAGLARELEAIAGEIDGIDDHMWLINRVIWPIRVLVERKPGQHMLEDLPKLVGRAIAGKTEGKSIESE